MEDHAPAQDIVVGIGKGDSVGWNVNVDSVVDIQVNVTQITKVSTVIVVCLLAFLQFSIIDMNPSLSKTFAFFRLKMELLTGWSKFHQTEYGF